MIQCALSIIKPMKMVILQTWYNNKCTWIMLKCNFNIYVIFFRTLYTFLSFSYTFLFFSSFIFLLCLWLKKKSPTSSSKVSYSLDTCFISFSRIIWKMNTTSINCFMLVSFSCDPVMSKLYIHVEKRLKRKLKIQSSLNFKGWFLTLKSTIQDLYK